MRLPIVALVCAFGAAACFQELDKNAAAGSQIDAGLTTDLDTPPINLGDAGTATNACAATNIQALGILQASCAPCHNQGAASAGNPPFGFIMDIERLKTEPDPRDGVSRLLIPGDPGHSVVFYRTLRNEMPPDQNVVPVHRPTVSDLSVLWQWISYCMGQGPVDASVSSPSDAGADGDAG